MKKGLNVQKIKINLELISANYQKINFSANKLKIMKNKKIQESQIMKKKLKNLCLK